MSNLKHGSWFRFSKTLFLSSAVTKDLSGKKQQLRTYRAEQTYGEKTGKWLVELNY